MKKTISILVLIIFAGVTLYAAESIFQYFNATSGQNAVTVEWKTTNEAGLTKFVIERSQKNNPFSKIADETAKGYASQYKYTDSDALMKSNPETDKLVEKTLSENTYSYRIKAIYTNGSYAYTDEIKVSPTINSIRRTWGMIKEMFR